jgi:hypothetical protein
MSEDFNYLSIELFVKSDKKVEQEGGKKKKIENTIKLTESITSVENLSETSESEDSKYMIKTIAKQLSSKIKDIK